MTSHSVTIITVTWNSAGILPAFLKAIPEGTKLIVSDNDSQDETRKITEALAPQTTFLANGQNLGYGTAANRALEKVETPFALLLNPDTILQPETIPALLAATEKYPQHAIFGCHLLDTLGNPATSHKPPLFTCGHRLFKPILKLGSQKRMPATFDTPAEVGWICGAAMFFRMELLRQRVGLFDENIFLYFEETDLCLRAARTGIPPVYVPKAVAVHWGGHSSGEAAPDSDSVSWKHYQLEKARYYMAAKYPRDVPAWIPVLYRYWYYLKMQVYRLAGNTGQTKLYQSRYKAARECSQ